MGPLQGREAARDQLASFVILRNSPEPAFFRFANFDGGSGPLKRTDEEWRDRR